LRAQLWRIGKINGFLIQIKCMAYIPNRDFPHATVLLALKPEDRPKFAVFSYYRSSFVISDGSLFRNAEAIRPRTSFLAFRASANLQLLQLFSLNILVNLVTYCPPGNFFLILLVEHDWLSSKKVLES